MELPPPWWWWPKLPWIPPDILPPLTDDFPFYYLTGGPLAGVLPAKCIEPPKDPIAEISKTEINPEDIVIIPQPLPEQERRIYPAPILSLQKNFYAEIDILEPTSLLSPSNIVEETISESFINDISNLTMTNKELADSIDCDTNDNDCNNLSY